MNDNRTAPNTAIIGRDGQELPKQARPVDQPNTDARGGQGDLDVVFELELPEEGGES